MKGNLKNIFEDSFNIDKNHEEILRKIGKRPRKLHTIKYALVPTCFIIVLCLTLNITISTAKYHQNPDYQEENKKVKNIIKYNFPGSDNYRTLDIDGRVEKITFEELLNNYPYLKNNEIFKNVNTYNIEYNNIYASSSEKDIELYNKKLGNLIRISDNTSDKYILAFISKTQKYFARCTPIDLDSLADSTINGIKVKLIRKFDKNYIAFFEYKNTYFDLELTNIKESELIDIITSITKGK